ncbi:MAG: hypothetical protein LBQ22_08095 [Bacteroidales bacterium]|jgi:hypothetical protein|nr:hypothetical protein [Bacteroidales bacterium]
MDAKYFENEDVNAAFKTWTWLNPKTAKNDADDRNWYHFLFLLFKNNMTLSEAILEKMNKNKKYNLSQNEISDIFNRYEDLRAFFKFLKEEGCINLNVD